MAGNHADTAQAALGLLRSLGEGATTHAAAFATLGKYTQKLVEDNAALLAALKEAEAAMRAADLNGHAYKVVRDAIAKAEGR